VDSPLLTERYFIDASSSHVRLSPHFSRRNTHAWLLAAQEQPGQIDKAMFLAACMAPKHDGQMWHPHILIMNDACPCSSSKQVWFAHSCDSDGAPGGVFLVVLLVVVDGSIVAEIVHYVCCASGALPSCAYRSCVVVHVCRCVQNKTYSRFLRRLNHYFIRLKNVPPHLLIKLYLRAD
jgi:hypothetical protein